MSILKFLPIFIGGMLLCGCESGTVGKPVRNLNSFYKTQLLTPGEGEEVNLVVSLEKSASYDDSGVTGEKSCWVLEAGAYGIYVGTDVRSAKKVCEVQLDELCVISRLEEALAPVQPYERLVPVETGKKGTDGEPVLEIGLIVDRNPDTTNNATCIFSMS